MFMEILGIFRTVIDGRRLDARPRATIGQCRLFPPSTAESAGRAGEERAEIAIDGGRPVRPSIVGCRLIGKARGCADGHGPRSLANGTVL